MISVIVCTYNRADILAETLEVLKSLKVPSGETLELWVVDNRSKDHTRRVIEQAAVSSPCPIHYLYEPEPGASHARNAGIKAARGEMLCFFDDDVIVDPDWITAMNRLFQETDAEMAGCRILRKWECEAPDWYSEEVGGPLITQDFGNQRIRLNGKSMYLISAGLAFRRGVFDRIGLFRGDLGRKGDSLIGGEDKELFQRAAAAGCSIYYEPDAVLHHRVEENRLTNDYMSRWFYAIGQTAGHQLQRSWKHSLTIAPLWAWGECLSAGFRFLFGSFLKKSKAERFAAEMAFRYSRGYLRECFAHWIPSGKGGCAFAPGAAKNERDKVS